jgi:tartrate dehydratase alpha subunit/fumarate hydratase class I-like protein
MELDNPACPDTGWPLFYFKIGNECVLEGGMTSLEESARTAVKRVTQRGYLRATMKHPLTGYDPGGNVGMNISRQTYSILPICQTYCNYRPLPQITMMVRVKNKID